MIQQPATPKSASLKIAFQSLRQTPSQTILKKSQLQKALIYTGSKYNRQTLSNQIKKCPQDISYEQFKHIFTISQFQYEQQSKQKEIEKLFEMYDFDKKGFIDCQDLRKVAQEIVGIQISQQERQEMLNLKCEEGQFQYDNKVYKQRFIQIMKDDFNFL